MMDMRDRRGLRHARWPHPLMLICNEVPWPVSDPGEELAYVLWASRRPVVDLGLAKERDGIDEGEVATTRCVPVIVEEPDVLSP